MPCVFLGDPARLVHRLRLVSWSLALRVWCAVVRYAPMIAAFRGRLFHCVGAAPIIYRQIVCLSGAVCGLLFSEVCFCAVFFPLVVLSAGAGAVIHLYRVKKAPWLYALALCVCCYVYVVVCKFICVVRLCYRAV